MDFLMCSIACNSKIDFTYLLTVGLTKFFKNNDHHSISGYASNKDKMGQSENSVVILLSGYSFVSLRHETMASITDSIS